ncbi:MAG: hypothetical protein R3B51_13440 [Thermodesulfobacteriota bacterium]
MNTNGEVKPCRTFTKWLAVFRVCGRPGGRILEEYNARDGYEAGVHAKEFLTKNAPDVAEVHGIYVIFPDSCGFVSVCWPEGSEQILIGVPGEPDDPFTIDIHDTDKKKLKDVVRGVIEG